MDVLTTCICSKSLQSGLALRPYGLWLTHQAPLSIGLSSQEYWSEFPCPPPEDLPNPENKRKSSAAPELQADFLPLSHLGSPFSWHLLLIWCLTNSRSGTPVYQLLTFLQAASALAACDLGFWDRGNILDIIQAMVFLYIIAMLVAQSCPTLCDTMGCSPPGSSLQGILQARTLEWVATPFYRGSSWPKDQTRVSSITGRLFTIWASKEAHIIVHKSCKW